MRSNFVRLFVDSSKGGGLILIKRFSVNNQIMRGINWQIKIRPGFNNEIINKQGKKKRLEK